MYFSKFYRPPDGQYSVISQWDLLPPSLLPIPKANFYGGQFSGGKFWCQSLLRSQNWPTDGFSDLGCSFLSFASWQASAEKCRIKEKLSTGIEFWKCNSKPGAFGKGKSRWSFSECFCQNISWILLLLGISGWIILVDPLQLKIAFKHLWSKTLKSSCLTDGLDWSMRSEQHIYQIINFPNNLVWISFPMLHRVLFNPFCWFLLEPGGWVSCWKSSRFKVNSDSSGSWTKLAN